METNKNFTTVSDGKTASIVSYFTIIGWLIAYFGMHKDNKTALSSYQLRQTLLLHLINIGVGIVGNIIISATLSATIGYLFYAIYLVIFILWVIGLIGAINGEKKPIPVIGEKAQTMFGDI